MNSIRKYFFLFNIAVLVTAMSFIPVSQKENSVTIKFDHYFGKEILKLDSVHYKNEAGQDLTISKFKYYIGNIELRNESGKNYFFSQYFLINEEEPLSKQISLNNIPDGKYSSMSFTISVDSAHNCSGAQSGALDPANAMFWTWNTGYIFLKLEGHSSASHSPGNIFEFHIGGYRSPDNCIRKVNLKFEHTFSTSNIVPVIHIKADASELFKTPTTVDLSKISSVTDHHNATMIADNYSDMFSIESIDQ